jgi:hypothetical protein
VNLNANFTIKILIMNRHLLYLLIFLGSNTAAQTVDTLNVKLKSGANIPYALPSVSGLTFSGIQGKDTIKVNLKSGLSALYSISLLDRINFSNVQTADSIFIELKGGTIRKYAISSIYGLKFIGWDNSTSVETVKSETEKAANLGQNYPNPFHAITTIPYFLPKQQNVTLTVSAMTGRVIVSLVQEQQSSGMHQVTWDASAIPGGIYFYRLQSGEFTETKKMILLK